ncbi:MAG: hypothetical protein IK085_04625 [Clostridia bacterium]|nr:hypothetical protein [Clostridia bacterium]
METGASFLEILSEFLNLGEAGVAIAQLITAINPASWWASGILNLIRMLLSIINTVPQ